MKFIKQILAIGLLVLGLGLPALAQDTASPPLRTGDTVVAFDGTYLYWNNNVGKLQKTSIVPVPFLNAPTGACSPQQLAINLSNGVLYTCLNSAWMVSSGGGGGVTTFSAGNLVPLFTTSVSNATSTPALSFALSNFSANTVFGNCTVSTAAPSACSLTAAMEPATTVNSVVNDTNVTGSIAGQALTLGWFGTLAKTRITSLAVFTDQSNTFSTGVQDFSAVTTFRPKFGTTAAIPATCAVGDIYEATDATAGQNWYFCTSSNTWTQQLNTGLTGANVNLSNLSSVSVNTSLLAQNNVNLGSALAPFKNLFLFGSGAYSTTSIQITGTPTSNRVQNLQDVNDTFVYRASADTLTNKTLDTAGAGNNLKINGNTVNAVTGTGSTVVLQTSPSLVTPNIGVATATSVNKLIITPPVTSATLTIQNGKTLGVNNSLTLGGNDGTTQTFAPLSGPIPALNQNNIWSTGTQDFSAVSVFRPKFGLTANLPGTCSVGDVYEATDATAGQNWYFCTAANVFTQQLNSGSGGGFSNPMTTLGDTMYGGAAGVATRLPGPAGPNGIPQTLVDVPSAGSAVAETWGIPGVPIDAQTGTSYTIPVTDDVHLVTGNNGSATAWTGFTLANNYVFSAMNLGVGLITYTPASGLVNGNASQIIAKNWFALHYTDNTNTFMPVVPTFGAFPNCTDSGGNHLNFASATGAITCGTSSSGAGTTTINGVTCNVGGSCNVNNTFDKGVNGLSNPGADATFTYLNTSTSGLTIAGTAPASVSTSTGTAATSLFNINGVIGGASSNAAGTGGAGSSPSLAGGAGGAGTGTNAVGGQGGTVTLRSGNGGASNGTGVNSNGGNIVINLGSAGTGGSGTAGSGGAVQINGSGAGAVGFGAGADASGNTQSCNIASTACIEAPASVTKYVIELPAANPVNNNSAMVFSNASPSVGSFAKIPQVVQLTSQYTNSTTGFTNVSGGNNMAFSVEASTNYTMVCTLYYQAASTGGLNIEFTGPSSPTAVVYSLVDVGSATTIVNSSVATAYSTSLGAAVTTATTNFPATITLSLQNGANAGTLQMLAKSSAAAQLQIQNGSWCQLQ